MVRIRTKKYGNEVNLHKIHISEKEIDEIKFLINSINIFNDDLELNLINRPIESEIRTDYRIRKEVFVSPTATGKAFLPIELVDEYKNNKICYCKFENFNRSILTIIHELNHLQYPIHMDYESNV